MTLYYKIIDGAKQYIKSDVEIDDAFKADEQEAKTYELEKIKKTKIAEIKAIRDSKNIEPITDIQALILNEDGTSTGQSSYFIFYTSRHPTNPASDPSSILTGAVVLNLTIPYSTNSTSGEKIIAALTPEIARTISAKLMLRNNQNYKLFDVIEASVKAASSIEEVEAITWQT